MACPFPFYGSIQSADEYFQCKLFEQAWGLSNPTERQNSLIAAARIVDSLNYKGVKHSVYVVLQQSGTVGTCGCGGSCGSTCSHAYIQPPANCNDPALRQALRDAEAAQELEFPRGPDTVVPERIEWASYEIAVALLDGVDPDMELENMSMRSHGIGSVQASYSRNQEPLEHFMNGVPSIAAWKFMRPFLRDDTLRRLIRVS